MQDKTVRQLYALVHRTEDAGTAEHASLHAAAALARQSNAQVHALLVVNGNDAGPAIEEAKGAGAHAITLLECPASVARQPQQLAASFIALIASTPGAGKNALYLVSAGTRAEEMAGAIAAHFDALPLGRPAAIGFDEHGMLKVTRSGFGGRLNVEQKIKECACIAAVRPPVQSGTNDQSPLNEPAVQMLGPVSLPPAYPRAIGAQTAGEANLDGARLVVSGGRGMAGEEGFSLLRDLAKKLDGALGGSLPAVDAGWAPVSRQVGQSGKYVSPEVYVAVGISGTPQHLAGIDPHTRIVAINKDPDAPIFQVARIGITAEWEAFLPALIEAIEARDPALSAQ